MKIIAREWLKDKVACLMLLGWMIISTIATILNARVVIMISNTVSDLENWKYHLTILLIVCVIQTIFSMIVAVLRPMATNHFFVSMNNRYSDKVLDADAHMFTKYSCAYINTMANYIWNISGAGIQTARFILKIINVIVLITNIYFIGGKMVIPIIGIYALGSIWAKHLFHQYEEYDKEADEIKKKRNQELENVVNGFMEVRSFSTQEYHRGNIKKFNDDIYKGRFKRSKIGCMTSLSYEMIDTLGMLVVILYSVNMLSKGLIQQAEAMSLVMLVFRIIEPLGAIMEFMDSFSQDIAMADSFDKIISYVNDTKPDGNIEMDKFRDKIEIKDISFSYDTTADVLKDVSMTFKKGQKIGICGVSGAGKSTLFKLLNRFYDEKEGSIYVDGVDIHAISKSSYRRCIAAVHQDNTIFPGTIWENVIYGNFNSPEYEVIKACQKANIYDFIMGLPEKFNTKVGPRGLTLSGGQKQRIALARLFLSNPDIILLDEATSALDNESETLIQDAIDALQDKTIITIAHRLSTIRNSDVIYVLGPDGVIEKGTHEELMDIRGEYFKMNK